MKLTSRIAVVLILSFVAIGCGGGGGNTELSVDLKGPDTVDEYSFEDFNVEASGDTGLTYQWAVDPSSAGAFSNRTSSTISFHPAGVTTDTPITIQVTVSSDNTEPVLVSKAVTVFEKVVMAPNVIEVDQLDMTVAEVDGDQFTFNYTGVLPEIKQGDILFGTEKYGEQPDEFGFLRKVNDLHDTGSQLIVVTEAVAMEEAILEGRFTGLLDFSGHQGEAEQSEFVQRTGCKVFEFQSMVFDLDEVVNNLEGGVLYSQDGLTIDIPQGEVSFTPEIELDMLYSIWQMGFTYFKVAASGTLDVDFDIRVEANGQYDKHEKKKVYNYSEFFFLNGIPCVAVFDFYAGFDVDANIDSYLTAGFDSSTNVTIGAEYENGVWRDISQKSQVFTEHAPDGQASGDILLKGYVRPEVKIYFCGAVGPGINAEPYLEFNGTGQLVPPCITYELAGGIKADVFVRAEIFGCTLAEYKKNILNIRIPFFTGEIGDCGNCPMTVLSIQGPSVINENGYGTYSISASGDTGITYQWFMDPTTAGYFNSPNQWSTKLTPFDVNADKEVTLRVEVDSDNCQPVLRTFTLIIENEDPCDDFIVGSGINGPLVIYENCWNQYSITAQGDSGITYFWSCNPSSAGHFDSPGAQNPSFYAYDVSSPIYPMITVSVNSAHNCGPELRDKPITINPITNPCDGFHLGQITGDSVIYENATKYYSINPSGDSPYNYSWSCIPSSAGYFSNPNVQNAEFHAYEVSNDSPVTIKVIVYSAHNCEPNSKTVSVTIKNVENPVLVVGEIYGPGILEENSSEEYEIAASGDTGITYQWSCPQNAGQFGAPAFEITSFTPYLVDADTQIDIKVVVGSDNCPSITRWKYNITVKDVPEPCDLVVGEISGPNQIDEDSSGTYSISASGEPDITYQWTCIPGDAGYFLSPTSWISDFVPNAVDSDTPIQLRVVVDSGDCNPVPKTKVVTIKDVTPPCDLDVGSISGPSQLDENTSGTYSVSASGDTGITYLWSCIPLNAGDFGSPGSWQTSFMAYGVPSNTQITIKVVVDSDNCDPVTKSKSVNIIDLGGVVTFPDPNLEQVIRDAINKPTGDIYQADLIGLTDIDGNGEGISNLEGIQYCVNLEWLDFSSNQISDIQPLQNLTMLKYMNLYNNQISDISPLQNLTTLERLYISYNQISDISPLQNLTKLKRLNLGTNQINDISPLQNLTMLQYLALISIQISDISPLQNLTKLEELNLRETQISDISPLQNLTMLEILFLDENQISDISPLQNLTMLQYLDLRENQISDIYPLVINSNSGGLSEENFLWLVDNPLSPVSINDYIPILEANGVVVFYW